ncbi:MAG: FliO/MopB family protein [Alphaproteobacteria bacterium]|nr:FliO/MopB family protein [Alphaproteobacteria bacterium]
MDTQYINTVLALCFVLGMILLLAWAARKFNPNNIIRTKKQRISVVETAFIDSNRKLVLIRRDNKEHLIVTGGTQDLLVEKDIPAPEPEPKPSKETTE